jgi:arylsulfatase A-like enzyme
VRLPGKQFAGKRVSGFVQIPDVAPTLLSLLGLKAPARATGQNFWPLVTGETRSLRDHTVMGYGWIAAVRMDEWNYSQIWNPQGYEGEYKPQLYDLSKDPEELHSVAERYPDVTQRLAEKIRAYAESGKELTRGSFNERESLKMGEVYVKGAR